MDLTDNALVKDFPLLWKIYDHIEAHPEEWNQHHWASKASCGTAHCFAGHAVAVAYPTAEPAWGFVGSDEGGWDHLAWFADLDGEKILYQDLGAKALGLTQMQGHALFRPDNTLEDIHSILMSWEREEADKLVSV